MAVAGVNPFIEMIEQSIGDFAANVLFGLIVMISFAIVLMCILFAGLAVRGAWRWLTRATWRDVIVSTERKALRR